MDLCVQREPPANLDRAQIIKGLALLIDVVVHVEGGLDSLAGMIEDSFGDIDLGSSRASPVRPVRRRSWGVKGAIHIRPQGWRLSNSNARRASQSEACSWRSSLCASNAKPSIENGRSMNRGL